MADADIRLIPCRSDNYAVLIHDPDSKTTILVDAPEAGPIAAVLDETGWSLDHILITHHHADHVAGVPDLKARNGALVTGPKEEASRIEVLDEFLEDGASTTLGPWAVRAIATPGHTAGPLSYWFPDLGVAFTGDTLFAMGCGRLFEGDAATMWASLKTLRDVLPDETRIYCGHEYTQKNAEFASGVDPDNATLRERVAAVNAARARGEPTIPTTMADEKATNPFLRADDPALAEAVGLAGESPEAVFAELRGRRDVA
ncbi:hydroxyacylglutathione hydrolase [Amorphus orientalis]|uniref:Hydroxyacylglutathione hydrolase n=1 Tax=Amorphus orientalis TaxID=649198 RepID=A0AAE3VS15_9HYPH|nr:hydroxyacylglutathione hydrolase [Amorphus orientalis]MDQ0317086.1 hydroxyacylglutathione hydrolase [Amorphus orientalis]